MPDLKVDLQALVDRINATSNADFVRRLLSGNKKHIIDENGDRLTHRLGYVESDGRAIVFPDVQSDGDTLKEYPFPQSLNRAVDRQDTVMMSIPEAEAFTAGYKEYYPQAEFKSGGGIHIKPSHRGRLTKLKKRTGKSEAELYNDGNPAHKKMVVFARNARKWKHDDGGLLENVADYDIDINYNNNIRVPEDWNEALLRTIGENLLISEENAGNIEKKKKVPFLQRVANAAILAENPAVATASGISLDERTGELLQNPDAPGAKELRKNLAVLSAAANAVPMAGIAANIPLMSAADLEIAGNLLRNPGSAIINSVAAHSPEVAAELAASAPLLKNVVGGSAIAGGVGIAAQNVLQNPTAKEKIQDLKQLFSSDTWNFPENMMDLSDTEYGRGIGLVENAWRGRDRMDDLRRFYALSGRSRDALRTYQQSVPNAWFAVPHNIDVSRRAIWGDFAEAAAQNGMTLEEFLGTDQASDAIRRLNNVTSGVRHRLSGLNGISNSDRFSRNERNMMSLSAADSDIRADLGLEPRTRSYQTIVPRVRRVVPAELQNDIVEEDLGSSVQPQEAGSPFWTNEAVAANPSEQELSNTQLYRMFYGIPDRSISEDAARTALRARNLPVEMTPDEYEQYRESYLAPYREAVDNYRNAGMTDFREGYNRRIALSSAEERLNNRFVNIDGRIIPAHPSFDYVAAGLTPEELNQIDIINPFTANRDLEPNDPDYIPFGANPLLVDVSNWNNALRNARDEYRRSHRPVSPVLHGYFDLSSMSSAQVADSQNSSVYVGRPLRRRSSSGSIVDDPEMIERRRIRDVESINAGNYHPYLNRLSRLGSVVAGGIGGTPYKALFHNPDEELKADMVALGDAITAKVNELKENGTKIKGEVPDFSHVTNVKDIAKIQKFIRDNNLVEDWVMLPLDISTLTYVSDDPMRAGTHALGVLDATLSGTRLNISSLSSDSMKMALRGALSNYGVGPGQYTVVPLDRSERINGMQNNKARFNRFTGKMEYRQPGFIKRYVHGFDPNAVLYSPEELSRLNSKIDSGQSLTEEELAPYLRAVDAVYSASAEAINQHIREINEKNRSLGLGELMLVDPSNKTKLMSSLLADPKRIGSVFEFRGERPAFAIDKHKKGGLLDPGVPVTKTSKYAADAKASSGDTYYDIVKQRSVEIAGALKRSGIADADSARLLPFILTQQILEGGWRLKRDDNNFGGMRVDGKNMTFDSEAAFQDAYLSMLNKRWHEGREKENSWQSAASLEDWARILNREDLNLNTKEAWEKYNKGKTGSDFIYLYAPAWENTAYKKNLLGTSPRVNAYLDMVRNPRAYNIKEFGGIIDKFKPSDIKNAIALIKSRNN